MNMLLKDGKRKALTLSYDDGVIQDKRLIAILDKFGLKATFNINTGMYYEGDTDPTERGRLTRKSSIALYGNSNHEVAVHALTHPFLERLSSSEIIYEITEDRKNIEKDYGTIARGMAYPFGTYDNKVIEILKMCKIAYSRTVKSTHSFDFPENWLMLHPTCHHNDSELMRLAERFVNTSFNWGKPMMFYVWGHSYEFDDNNNWHVIEQFAQYIGNKEDIWYATNTEIYDYVAAYNNLNVSYEQRIINNPSAIDVWVEIKGQAYCIKAGETLTI